MASRFLPLRRSAQATLWAAGAAAVLSVVAAATLDGGTATLALIAAGGFVACALYAVLGMSRYVVAAIACVSSALAIGAALAFLRMLGLAWDQDPNSVTTVSSQDADPYFFGAVAATGFTLAVLLVGAAWPQPRRTPPRRRPTAGSTVVRPRRAPSSVPKKPGTARKPGPARKPVPAARYAQITVRRVPVGARLGVSASSRGARRS
ncbi:hypothetical protein SCMU_06970 [Sinomonas cyclohexanicum]|uniref:Uncharacterized protein n=1 Tax=Sinomonas cyclohexanicum TaxID=322009 RepID=A0ABN6FE92_SINCY|nr:hypothetical protein [Corynebacterium cyclohexanicum]BCT74855.1 hypothetical protein SCMU_06970 [Corynebacterium cyclohexanicum]